MNSINLSRQGKIAELQLDNPAKLNAFTVDMLDQLATHLVDIERDASIAVVMLTASGDRAFCAGAD
ncbi:MAG: enoyl-CoA hydratase/isomerase family protein, partial [Roseobacter sp.]